MRDVGAARVSRLREEPTVRAHPDDVEVERPETELVHQLFLPVADVAQHVRVSPPVGVQMHHFDGPSVSPIVAQHVLEAALDRLQTREQVQDPQRLGFARQAVRRVHVEPIVRAFGPHAVAYDLRVRHQRQVFIVIVLETNQEAVRLRLVLHDFPVRKGTVVGSHPAHGDADQLGLWGNTF